MLPVKLVRSLVLGETMKKPLIHDDDDDEEEDNDNGDDPHAHDADDDEDNTKTRRRASKDEKLKKKRAKRRMPLLLFTPTRELISDTFRLAAIARDIGMDFQPTPTLSHLIFSWAPPSPSPSPSSSSLSSSWASSSTPSTSSPFSPSCSSMPANNRPSVSSSTSSSSATLWTTLPSDAVPLPFPSLSTPSTSLSLLRYFVSLSKGLFKLVFFNLDPDSEIHSQLKIFNTWNLNYGSYYRDSDGSPPLFLHSRVSSRRVGSMDEFSRELAGYGWTLFRTLQKPKCRSSDSSSSSSEEDSVYLFRKNGLNRVRVRARARGGDVGHVGECRMRELRLPSLDFKNGVPLRILLYILLMTDDVFYLA